MCRYTYDLIGGRDDESGRLDNLSPYSRWKNGDTEGHGDHVERENDTGKDEDTIAKFVPRVTRVRVHFAKNERDRRKAAKGRPYVVPYHRVADRVNYVFDYYGHRVIEVNPMDWETVIGGRVVVFSYGATSPTFVHETYTAFYRCAAWHMCT